MGPTLARLAKRAAPGKRVIGVARFSAAGLQAALERHGIECIAADLLSRGTARRIARRAQRGVHGRPQVRLQRQRVAHLGDERARAGAGGRALRSARASSRSPPPACIRSSTSTARAPAESAPLTPPPGEYANSCVARERMFQHWSHERGTAGRLLRLSYAIDMRYGVLHDLARKLRGAPADRPDDGPRQHHLAGRRQRLGVARARTLHRTRPAASTSAGRRSASATLRAGTGAALGREAAVHRQRGSHCVAGGYRRGAAPVRLTRGTAGVACSTAPPTGCRATWRA